MDRSKNSMNYTIVSGLWNIGREGRDFHEHYVPRFKEFLEIAFKHVGLDWKNHVEISKQYERPNEVNHLLGDPSKAQSELGWKPKTTFLELVRMMVDSDLKLAERDKVLLNKGLISKTWED